MRSLQSIVFTMNLSFVFLKYMNDNIFRSFQYPKFPATDIVAFTNEFITVSSISIVSSFCLTLCSL